MAIDLYITSVSQTSINKANNTSNVRVRATAVATDGAGTTASCPGTITLRNQDNVTQTFTFSHSIPEASTTTICETTFTVSHSVMGALSLFVQVGIDYYGDSYYSGGTNWTGSSIDRVTMPVFKRNGNVVDNVTMCATAANSTSVTIDLSSRVSSTLTHTVNYSFGELSGQIASSVGDSTTWTPVLNTLGSQIPNTTSGVCTISCSTYSGSTLIGTKSSTINVNIGDDVIPSVAISSVADYFGYKDNVGVFVTGKSKYSIAFTVSAVGGATITSKTVEANGEVFSGNSPVVTSVVKGQSYNSIYVTATDSRGRTRSVAHTISQNQISANTYTSPAFTSYSVVRCNLSGTADDSGAYAKVTCSYSCCSVGTNSASACVYKKLASDSSWTAVSETFEPDGDKMSMDPITITSAETWDIRIELSDTVGEHIAVVKTVSVAKAEVSLKKGYQMAIGKTAEYGTSAEPTLEVEWKALFNNGVYVKSGQSYENLKSLIDAINNNFLNKTYPIGSIYMSVSSTSPATLFGGTWSQISGGTYLVAANGSSYVSENSYGSNEVTLTVDQIPAHTHNVATVPATNKSSSLMGSGSTAAFVWNTATTLTTTSVGGGDSFDNRPQSIAVYIWKRTA